MDDAERIHAYRETGDPAQFDALVERHRDRVFRLIVSILGPGRGGEAEELTQDVFVKVYLKLDGFRGDAKFSTWLYRVAFNVAANHRARASFRAIHEPEETLEMKPTDRREADPFRVTADARAREALADSMAELPDLYRSVLHLRYWLGMTVAEVAGALSIPDGTVKSYLFRARARLARRLRGRGVVDV